MPAAGPLRRAGGERIDMDIKNIKELREYIGSAARSGLAEIKKELGSQFDTQIGQLFINSDVYQLSNVIQDGFGEVYKTDSFTEYGTVDVGTLVR